jgi:hypothetical protein
VFHRVMDAVPAGGWQVAQGPDGLTVLLSGVREGFADRLLSDLLERELAAQGVVVPPVKVRRVPTIPRTTVGKAPSSRPTRSITQGGRTEISLTCRNLCQCKLRLLPSAAEWPCR